MSWLPGTARVSFTHSEHDTILRTQSSNTLRLSDFCRRVTPPCILNPFLCGGHLQTARTIRREQEPVVHYKRRLFDCDDPRYAGSFAVDFVVHEDVCICRKDSSLPSGTTYWQMNETIGSSDSKPMAVVLHGVAGGSQEAYVKHVLAPLVQSGWEACVVISRGCAQSKLTSGLLYNARSTWDLRQTVTFLREQFPNRPLYGVGFSLGANILVNYLAEEGENCAFRAATVFSNPWNLEIVHLHAQRHWVGLKVYSKYLGSRMKRLVLHNADQVLKNHGISNDAVESIKYLFDFDNAVQVPTWGYPTKGAYYRDASSVDALLGVRIPLFAVNALDDPISHREALPMDEFRTNPMTVLCTTSGGGHLAWYQSDGTRWFVRPLVGFLRRMNDEIKSWVTAGVPSSPKLYYPVRRKLTHSESSFLYD